MASVVRPSGTSTPSPPNKPWALKALPPFPPVALQLLSLLDDSEAPMEKIVGLLRVDPALSAEILRVANSALYGLSRSIDSLSQAMVVLGTDAVKRLALTVALGRFPHSFLRDKSLRTCWDHSIASALVAEQLALAMNQPEDRAYTAGLLHDVGLLALLACYPSEYENLIELTRENRVDPLECERRLFDIDHCAAGEWLATHWNLPADFVEAIAHHHTAEAKDTSLQAIVTAAHSIANALGFPVFQEPTSGMVTDVIAGLSISDQEKTAERLESLPGKIRSAIATVTPCSGSGA